MQLHLVQARAAGADTIFPSCGTPKACEQYKENRYRKESLSETTLGVRREKRKGSFLRVIKLKKGMNSERPIKNQAIRNSSSFCAGEALYKGNILKPFGKN